MRRVPGRALLEVGRREAAAVQFEEVLCLHPNRADARQSLESLPPSR